MHTFPAAHAVFAYLALDMTEAAGVAVAEHTLGELAPEQLVRVAAVAQQLQDIALSMSARHQGVPDGIPPAAIASAQREHSRAVPEVYQQEALRERLEHHEHPMFLHHQVPGDNRAANLPGVELVPNDDMDGYFDPWNDEAPGRFNPASPVMLGETVFDPRDDDMFGDVAKEADGNG